MESCEHCNEQARKGLAMTVDKTTVTINGKTKLYYVDGQGTQKTTRVLGHAYNRIVKNKKKTVKFTNEEGKVFTPKYPAWWRDVSKAVRAGGEFKDCTLQ